MEDLQAQLDEANETIEELQQDLDNARDEIDVLQDDLDAAEDAKSEAYDEGFNAALELIKEYAGEQER